MKIRYCFIVFMAIVFQSCIGQTKPKTEIYNKEFDWSITIPEGFDTVSAAQWAKQQNRGAEAIEKTYDEKIDNRPKTIFVFKSGQFNYFESNYQPFDASVDGDYLASCKAVNDVLYNTFIDQMPGVKVDTTTSVEKIDNLDFQTLTMTVTYPNKIIYHLSMFSRLFGKREFSVNIMYVDKAKGELMLNAWKNSTFSRK